MSTEPLGHDADQPRRLATMLSLIVGAITVVWRLVPHPAHCLPLGALGIYGGAKLSGWKPVLLPLAVLLISDFGLWILAGFDLQYLVGLWRIYVYASFLVYVLIGRLLRGRESALTITGASLLGSLQFFVVTNFCVWLFQPFEFLADGVPGYLIYSRDLSGLLTCFAAALPFFQGDSPLHLHALFVGDPRYAVIYLVAGDLLFTGGLFGLHALLVRKPVPAASPQHTAAQV